MYGMVPVHLPYQYHTIPTIPFILFRRTLPSSSSLITMAKKSKAQIKRMSKRAEARGESYQPPLNPDPASAPPPPEKLTGASATPSLNDEEQRKLKVARQLEAELQRIEKDGSMKAKERRSAKRKAEAIASEEAGCSAVELLESYTVHKKKQSPSSKKKKAAVKGSNEKGKDTVWRSKNPYIVFFGQLSFKTTQESLLKHIKDNLGDEFDVSEQTVKIRLLTDSNTAESRGMAFVEVTDPHLLYALLRLHQTFLEGRRINVEKTTGGKARSANKKRKLEHFQKEQADYFSEVVDKMLQEYYKNGSIQPDELDAGVIALFKRHSASVVQAALERYVESNGAQKDNPSAYLTCLVGKMAEEGIFDKDEAKRGKRSHDKPHGGRSGFKGRNESVLEKEGVYMHGLHSKGPKDISQIFPSFKRGRGRGGKP